MPDNKMRQSAEAAGSSALAEQVSSMGRLLGEVITALEGPETLALEERIRTLAKQSRAGEPDAAMSQSGNLLKLP